MKRVFIFGIAILSFSLSNKLSGQLSACFNLPTTTNYSINPQSIISNDIDADGNMDLITTETSAYKVTLHLGNGSGTYSPTSNFFTGPFPQFITISDFNSDGKKDIASANLMGGISILTATALGSFSSTANYTASSSTNPIGIVSGDFNGDSKPDLAVAYQSGASMAVLMNSGIGTFPTATTYTLSNNARSICSRDFNSDGKPDIAVLIPPNELSILNTNVSGFYPMATYTLSASTNQIISDDYNNDGFYDIALAQATSSRVAIMNGNGLGVFAAGLNYTVGTTPFILTSGDFNTDGKLDLVSVNSVTNANISVLAGNGSGSFTNIATYSVSSHPDGITSGDYNNDGRKDIATCKYTNKDYTVLLNCLGVGINEKSARDNISIYPNPSRGNYSIELINDSQLTLYNTLGELVKKEIFFKGSNNLEIVSEQQGLYFLEVLDLTSGDKQVIKLIKE